MKDEKNPDYLFQTTESDLLMQIADGEINPVKIARKELVARGHEPNSKATGRCPNCDRVWLWDWCHDCYYYYDGSEVESERWHTDGEHSITVFTCACGKANSIVTVDDKGMTIAQTPKWDKVDWEEDANSHPDGKQKFDAAVKRASGKVHFVEPDTNKTVCGLSAEKYNLRLSADVDDVTCGNCEMLLGCGE